MDYVLRHNPMGPGLSTGAIDSIRVLLATEGFPELSFLELLRELMIFGTADDQNHPREQPGDYPYLS